MPNHCSPRANCNAMKRDRDDTDFRTVRREYDRTEQGCPFCSISSGDVQLSLRTDSASSKFQATLRVLWPGFLTVAIHPSNCFRDRESVATEQIDMLEH
jgi:hypothetical protein